MEPAIGVRCGKMYRVVLSPAAAKFYRAADRPLARKLARCFKQLEEAPRTHPNVKPLKGPLARYFRFRVGDHRVIYRISEAEQLVSVILVAHRQEAYE